MGDHSQVIDVCTSCTANILRISLEIEGTSSDDRCYFDNMYLEGTQSCTNSNNVVLDKLSNTNGFNTEYEYKGIHNNQPWYRGIGGTRRYLYYYTNGNYHIAANLGDVNCFAYCGKSDILSCTANTWYEL